MEDTNVFQIKSYGWQELAILYSPHVSPETATRYLRNWINKMPDCKNELENKGWKSGQKILTPAQVGIIIHHLGEP